MNNDLKSSIEEHDIKIGNEIIIDDEVPMLSAKISLKKLASQLSEKEIMEFKRKFSFIHDTDNVHQLEPMELFWDNLTIKSVLTEKRMINGKSTKVEVENIILNSVKGVVSPATFTAILGPSGSGKTTLLNFLSGRILSTNLKMNGCLKLNNVNIQSIDDYNNKIAFVQQDDILLAIFTPLEALSFSASIRLNLSASKRMEKVLKLLRDLGLEKCSETRIGNELMRGVSGGERKRTSIGVELLTNPSMIFLDEPTTGLDSNTAITIMYLLRDMANSGRTVVSVIHQPSTEIFSEFDKLILICKGNIIYQGDSQKAMDYFNSINYICPKLTNPADYFMKIMNPQGLMIEHMEKGEMMSNETADKLKEEFAKRVEFLVNSYKNTNFFKNLNPSELEPVKIDRNANSVSWTLQFYLLFWREFNNIVKSPFNLRVRLLQYIVFSCVCIIVYHDLGTGNQKVQNTNGLIFFISNLIGMASIQGSLLTFSMDRPLFMREALNRSYTISAFYLAKSVCEFIFQLIYPLIMLIIIYFGTDLNKNNDSNFWIFLLTMELGYFAGSSYGLIISVFVPKFQVAIALTPVLILPFMIFAGYLVNQENIPYFFYEFEYISPFKYTFTSLIITQYDNNIPDKCKPSCDPVKDLSFSTGRWESIIILGALGLGLRILAYFGLQWISNPTKPKIKE